MTAIVTWFLLIPSSLYFKYFPILFNEDLSNAFVLFLISVFAIGATYGVFIIKKETDIRMLLLQTLLFVFFALQSGDINNQDIVVNRTIPYSFSGQYFDKSAFLRSTSLLYNDGTLVIVYNQSV